MSTNTHDSANGHCPECEKCLEVLHIVLDDEATEEQVAFVKAHVDSCSRCFDCYEVDKSLKESVRVKISKKQLPDGLIEEIHLRIHGVVS